MKKTVILNTSSFSLPVTPDKIESVSWEAFSFPNYDIEDYNLSRVLTSPAHKTEWELEVETNDLISEYVYYRFKVHYNDGSDSGWVERKLAVRAALAQGAIVSIPDLNVWYDYKESDAGDVSGTLKVQTSPYVDYTGTTTHHQTICQIYNSSDDVIFEKTGSEGKELTEFDVPLDLFQDGSGYTINVRFVASSGVEGGTRSYRFESFPKDQYFILEPIGDLVSNKIMYFKLTPQTLDFDSVTIELRNLEGDLLSSTSDQTTIYPLLSVPILGIGDGYKIFAKAKLKDGSVTTAVQISAFVAKGYDPYPVDSAKQYIDKYSDLGNVSNPGYSTQGMLETSDGHILIASASDKTVKMYKKVDDGLVFVRNAFVIPNSDGVTLMYINMLERYDGRFIVNYAANTNDPNGQESVFRLYDYNVSSGKFSLVNESRVPNHFEGTAICNSMVVDSRNDVYFIPNRMYIDGEDQQLKLFRLDAQTLAITTVADVPFAANRYVNIVATKVKDEFLLLGGSKQRYKDVGRVFYKRDNDTVHTFNSDNKIISESAISLASLPKEFHAAAAYLRQDGKVMLFNNVELGLTNADQSTYVIDTESGDVVHHDNDLPSNITYRGTVVLRNGDYLRLTTNTKNVHPVRLYVSDSLEVLNLVTVEGDKETELIVKAGETKVIADPRLYEIINIQGADENDTGRLTIIKDGAIKTYDHTALIVPYDRTMTRAEASKYSTIVVSDGAKIIYSDGE